MLKTIILSIAVSACLAVTVGNQIGQIVNHRLAVVSQALR